MLIRLAVALAALSSAAAAQPTNRDEMIREMLANRASLFRDPDSVKDAAIGKYVPFNGLPAICMRANAKNGYGGYIGLRDYLVVYQAGRFDLTPGRFSDAECGPWEPAPGLNGRRP